MTEKTVTRLKHLAESTRDMFVLDPRIIKIRPDYNARDFTLVKNIEHVAEIKDSMIENGQKVAVEVTYEAQEIWLDKGETRLRAALEMIEEGHVDFKLLAVQSQKGANEVDRTVDLIVENDFGKSLEPLEKASVYRRLILLNMTVEQIAKRVGKTKQHVEDLLRLNGASQSIHQLIRDGRISATQAVEVCREKGIKRADAILERAAEKATEGGRKKADRQDVADASGKIRITQQQMALMREALEKIADGVIDPSGMAESCLIACKIREQRAAA